MSDEDASFFLTWWDRPQHTWTADELAALTAAPDTDTEERNRKRHRKRKTNRNRKRNRKQKEKERRGDHRARDCRARDCRAREPAALHSHVIALRQGMTGTGHVTEAEPRDRSHHRTECHASRSLQHSVSADVRAAMHNSMPQDDRKET